MELVLMLEQARRVYELTGKHDIGRISKSHLDAIEFNMSKEFVFSFTSECYPILSDEGIIIYLCRSEHKFEMFLNQWAADESFHLPHHLYFFYNFIDGLPYHISWPLHFNYFLLPV
ncbi:hypothetical protein ACJX0J_016663, partial [Zea mays]